MEGTYTHSMNEA